RGKLLFWLPCREERRVVPWYLKDTPLSRVCVYYLSMTSVSGVEAGRSLGRCATLSTHIHTTSHSGARRGEGGALSCAPSADVVAGDGAPLSCGPPPGAVAGDTGWRRNSHDGSTRTARHSARPHYASQPCSNPSSPGCSMSYAAVNAPVTWAECLTLNWYGLSMRTKQVLPAKYALCSKKTCSVCPSLLGNGCGISC